MHHLYLLVLSNYSGLTTRNNPTGRFILQSPYRLSHWLMFTGIFCLPILALVMYKGISYPASLIWLASLAVLWPWNPKRCVWDCTTLLTVAAFSTYPLAILISMYSNDKWMLNDFDKPSRFLLVLTVFFAVRKVGLPKGLLFFGFALGAIGSGMTALHEIFSVGVRRVDAYTNAIVFGDLSALLGIFALIPLVQWLFKKQPVTQAAFLQNILLWLAIPAFILGILAGYFSGTRAVLFCAPVLLAMLFFYYLPNHTQRLLSVLAILLLLTSAYITVPGVQKMVQSSVFTSKDYIAHKDVGKESERSVGLRLEMWKAALLLGAENPFTGIGPDNFRSSKNQLIEDGKIDAIVAPFGHAHNDFLTLFAEAGVLGFFSLVFFYGFTAFYAWQQRQRQPALAITGLLLGVGFALFGLSQAMLTHNLSTTFVVFMAAIILGALQRPDNQGS